MPATAQPPKVLHLASDLDTPNDLWIAGTFLRVFAWDTDTDATVTLPSGTILHVTRDDYLTPEEMAAKDSYTGRPTILQTATDIEANFGAASRRLPAGTLLRVLAWEPTDDVMIEVPGFTNVVEVENGDYCTPEEWADGQVHS